MLVTAVMLGFFLILIPAKTAYASGIVRFGSESYTSAADADFKVGVYIETSDEIPLGGYSVNLVYDPNMITYVDGAETGGDGNLLVMGVSQDGKQGMHMLTFHALGNPGPTAITVTGATVNDTSGMPMEVGGFPAAPIVIQTPETRMPEYLRVNDKEVAGLTEGQTEYTFSVPYAESFTVEAPEGFTVNIEAPANPQPGRNNITVVLTQPNANPLTLMLHANMEPKEEEEKSEPESDSEPKSVSEPEEIPSESVVTSETVSEPVAEPVSEPVPVPGDGKTTLDGGFPPNNQIHYEFKNSDLYWIGGCILGAVILFILILLIVNGRSVEEQEEEDEDADLEDWEDLNVEEKAPKARAKRDDSERGERKNADRPEKRDSERTEKKKSDRPEKKDADRKEKKESGSKSGDTKMGDDLVAATYRKESGNSVGDEIVAATYKKGAEKRDADDEAEERLNEKEEREAAKEERAAAKEERAKEKELAKEERLKEKEEREAAKEERAAAKEERAKEKELAKEERLKEKEERERAKEEQAAAKEEQAREKEEQASAKEEGRKEKEERARVKEAAREKARLQKEQEQQRRQQEQQAEADERTGEFDFLPLDYDVNAVKGSTNEDEEDNIVGNAELVRSESIADFDDDTADDISEDMSDAIAAATEAEIAGAAGATAAAAAIVADGKETVAKTLIMDSAELKKQLLDVTETESGHGKPAEEFENYDEDFDDEDYDDDDYDDDEDYGEDEDGFIDIDSIVSDRKPKH